MGGVGKCVVVQYASTATLQSRPCMRFAILSEAVHARWGRGIVVSDVVWMLTSDDPDAIVHWVRFGGVVTLCG